MQFGSKLVGLGACIMLLFVGANLVRAEETAADEAAEIAIEAISEDVAEIEVVATQQQAGEEELEVVLRNIVADPNTPSEYQELGASEFVAARLVLQLAEQPLSQILVAHPQQQLMQFGGDFVYTADGARLELVPAGSQVGPGGLAQLYVFAATPPQTQDGILRVTPTISNRDGLILLYDVANGAITARSVDGVTGESEEPEEWEPGEYMIGVALDTIDSELLRQHLGIEAEIGLVVNEVYEDSPAKAAGLEIGDILLKAGDTDLRTGQDLVNALQAFATDSGDAIAIEVIHQGERKTVEVTPTTRQELLGYDFTQTQDLSNKLVWSALLQPQLQNQWQVQPPMAAWYSPPQDGLTQSIQSLTEQIQQLQDAIDRLEQKLDE